MVIRPTVKVGIDSTQENRLRVSELHAAAVLRACGIRFVDIEPTAGGRVAFVFEDEDGRARGLLRAHRSDGVDVNSAAMSSALAWAKDLAIGARGERR